MQKSKTTSQDRVLFFVKIIIVIELLCLISKLFDIKLFDIVSQNIWFINIVAFLSLLVYFFWWILKTKQNMTCTGCIVANTGANVLLYSVILLMLAAVC
ncbi:MAG: hypothetical protein DRG11_06175 [Epsilonproteobacteria bacterium]|nr:MAG: hypothetical protein DRG11_06175 [Campylobacterota bacterium]